VLWVVGDASKTLASTVSDNKPYPAFQVGVTGVWVSIEPGHVMTVQRVEDGTPGVGKVQPGDIVVSANGRAIEGEDPRVPLGAAITEAEAVDGTVAFTLMRDGNRVEAEIVVPALGRYADGWPTGCEKSEYIVDHAAQRLAAMQDADGWFDARQRGGLTQCLAALFLLSTGDDAYADSIERFAHALAAQLGERPGSSVWHLGYQVIFLSEYYLDTGDRSVLPALTNLCRAAAEGQSAGSWGHHLGNEAVGYVQSGMMNSAGVTMFLGLTLARECGVTVSEEAFQKSLVFFYRMVGHGSVCYGDHRAEIYADTNGRNAAIAAAFAVLGEAPYTQAAEHLALMVADSYFGHEMGHTGGGFNVIWRGTVLPLLPVDYAANTQRHMAELAWYYDLCRTPDGGFRMLPSAPSGETRYANDDWGHGVGLTYTAPRRTLRITGRPRTEHSVATPALDPLPWGTPSDTAFFGTEHATGYGDDDEPPHVTFAKITGRDPLPVEYCTTLLRHYNPVFRTFAGRKLAELRSEAAYDAIEAALQHDDPRVRRAACDAISSYNNWGRNGHGAGLPRDVVSERFVPHLEAILNDEAAAFWETDGALWALSVALPEDIRRNMAHVHRYAQHDEWYLRESAYWVVVGLCDAMTGEEFLFLADMFVDSRHVYERSSYDGGINFLLNRVRLDLDDETIAAYVQKLGDCTRSIAIAAGYDEMAARHEAVHRVMMVLARFDDPPYELIAKDLADYLADWTPDNQHSAWLVSGNKWQPGLAQIAGEMGAAGRPLIVALNECDARSQWDERNAQQVAARDKLREAVAAYEAAHGSVGD